MISISISIPGKNLSAAEIGEAAIALDNAGIDELCDLLQKLKSRRAPDHLHLSTSGCGEGDLDAAPPEPPDILIEELRIAKITE